MIGRNNQPNFVSRDVGRLSAFSDAVFAIALTLPVLEIKLPHGGGHFNAELRAMLPGLFVYLITFSVGGSQWLAHYRMFGHIRRIDSRAMNSNLTFLLIYSLIPLTTSLLMNNSDQPLARMIYSLNLALLALVLAWLSRYLNARGYFERPDIERYYRARGFGLGSVFLLQAVVALVWPDAWPWMYALFPLIFVVLRRSGLFREPQLEDDELYAEENEPEKKSEKAVRS